MTLPLDPYFDRQYNARASVPDYERYARQYRELSDVAHASLKVLRDVAYGPGSGERLDIFPAAQPGAPVLLFIHGGYWRALSKADSAFMAPALTAAGACVVVIDYDLAPAVSLDHIVDQTRRALAWVHRHIGAYGGDPARIVASGSSAGGHLVGMLLAEGWHADYQVPPSVLHGALPISGLFDLQPLRATHINVWLQLDEAAAQRNSPQFHVPAQGPALVVSHGALESAEFARQSGDYLAAWQARGLPGQFVAAPQRNHFDVVLQLGEPGTVLYRHTLKLLGLADPDTPA